ncbi:hypothetical protein [Streptomyces avermitilis]|uniref:hypothetical protein n=1 Tax=Streptomyces avermitilis TaxID=33903 RepID=UPI0033BE5233
MQFGWPVNVADSLHDVGPLSPCLPQFEDLDFVVGDALVGEPVVGAGTLESLLELAVFTRLTPKEGSGRLTA